MTEAGTVIVSVLGAVALAGFAAGLSSARLPGAAFVFTIAIVVGFVVMMAAFGAWAASCPSCGGHIIGEDTSRPALTPIVVIEGALIAGVVLAFMRLGVLLSRLFFRGHDPSRAVR
jgi:hypothetical protein